MNIMHPEKYRLVALDMDGTLLNSDHETSAYTREVIDRVAQSGKIAAISTGRCLSELWEHFKKMPGIRYAICENGACVYDIWEKKTIYRIALPHEQVMKVMDIADGFDLTIQFFKDGQSCMQCTDIENLKNYHIYDFAGVFEASAIFVGDLRACYLENPGSIGKFNLYCASEKDKYAAQKIIETEIPEAILSDSIGVGLEVSPANATKGNGLRKLCEHLGITVEESIAVGDSSNDIDIIRTAGLSVAMGNAIQEVKDLADVITEDCDHDGAAKAIQRYMLGENV